MRPSRSTGIHRHPVVPALVVLPSSLGRDFGSNGPLWSLAFEAVYYALYPAWLWVRQRNGMAAFIVDTGSSAWRCTSFRSAAFPCTVLAHYPIWLAGRSSRSGWSAPASRRDWRCDWRGVIRRGVVLASHPRHRPHRRDCRTDVWRRRGDVLCRGAVAQRARGRAEFLGIRSYTIYIVHFPLLALISAYVIHTHRAAAAAWLARGVGAIACVAFGCVCFELCERHFLHSRYRDESAAP